MANREVLAIGTSAGGVEALLYLVKQLPKAFPASILVTIHLPSYGRSVLDDILTRTGALSAQFAKDGDILKKGRIYIAPEDRHLLLDGDHLSLGIGPRENNSRPAIDPMLHSAAVCCGARTIGVVLTGTLGDGLTDYDGLLLAYATAADWWLYGDDEQRKLLSAEIDEAATTWN